MKKIFSLITLFGALLITSCHTSKIVSTDNYSVSVAKAVTSKPDTLNAQQMDSVINADKLPALAKWVQNVYKDESTFAVVTYKTLYDKSTNTVYTVKILNSSVYVLSKRSLQTK